MATIQERKNRNGKTSYRAIVRLKGVPPQTATFVRKTDARNWAHRVETEVRERRYFPKAIAGNHNLAEAITRYLEDVMPRKSRSAYTQKGQLQWWSNELGVYSLADLTPDFIIGARDRLLKKPNKTGGKLSKATVNRYMAALSHVLPVARDEWRWLDESPMPMVGKLKEAKGRVPYLVTDEGVGLEESQLITRAALRGGNRAVWKPWPAVCSTANRCGAANCTALPMNVRRRLSITNVTAAGAWPKSGKRKSTTR